VVLSQEPHITPRLSAAARPVDGYGDLSATIGFARVRDRVDPDLQFAHRCVNRTRVDIGRTSTSVLRTSCSASNASNS
jgi:hypothetical protein